MSSARSMNGFRLFTCKEQAKSPPMKMVGLFLFLIISGRQKGMSGRKRLIWSGLVSRFREHRMRGSTTVIVAIVLYTAWLPKLFATVRMDWVTVGDPGNAADLSHGFSLGAVG